MYFESDVLLVVYQQRKLLISPCSKQEDIQET